MSVLHACRSECRCQDFRFKSFRNTVCKIVKLLNQDEFKAAIQPKQFIMLYLYC